MIGNFDLYRTDTDDIAASGSIGGSHNLIGRLSGGIDAIKIVHGRDGNVVSAEAAAVLDPVLRDNGGPTKTHALVAGSRAVNGGSNALAVDADGRPSATDQRGAGFPRVLDGTVDVGAVERPNAHAAARDDAVSTTEDSPATGNLFADHGSGPDADPDGDPLVLIAVNGSAYAVGRTFTLAGGATLTVNADGAFIYDPRGARDHLAAGETATETFTYAVSDGFGGTSTGIVTVTVHGVNDAPIAAPGAPRTNEHRATAGDLLAGAGDAEGDALSVTAVNGSAANVGLTVTLPSGARLNVNADGTYAYDPNGKFVRLRRGETATDSFTHTVSDGNGGFTTATVTVTIEGGGHEADLVGYSAGEWRVAASNGSAFADSVAATWANVAWDAVKTGDFDGDGRADVLGLLKGEWYVGLARAASSGLTYFATSRWAAWNPRAAWEHVLAGDVDGDGKDDVVAEVGGEWYGALSTGSAFGLPARLTRTSDAAWHLSALADVTGDGKDDLVLVLGGDWYVGVSTGSTFGSATRWARTGAGAYQLLTLADLNADGKADAVGFVGGEWRTGLSNGTNGFATGLRAKWANATWLDPLVGDFDGDGTPDLAARYGGQWYVGLSNAAGGEKSRGLWASWNNLAWKDVRAGDFDGDGRSDIAGRYNGEWYVAQSTGSGFATSRWARWNEAAWRAVAAADADGYVPPVSAGGAVARTPASSPASLAGLRLAPAASADDEPLAFFWSKAAKDDELAAGLFGIA